MSRRWHNAAVTVMAVIVAAVTVADLHQHYGGLAGAGLAVGLVRAVAVIGCRWRPVTALIVTALASVATAAVSTPTSSAEPWPWPVSSILALVVVLVYVGITFPPERTGLRVLLAATVTLSQVAALGDQVVREGAVRWGGIVPALVLTTAAALVADLVHTRRRVTLQLAQQQATTVSETAARLRSEERARIARELHDVVAHHLSVVVVRADSAPQRVTGLDDAAIAEFRAIGNDARESLDQMRQVLRLLRADGRGLAATTPQPTLVDAWGLIADARDAGAHIEVVDELPDLGGVAGLVAYRTLQESITNALRHAPGAPVTVHVERDARELHVCVENPAPSTSAAVDGHGLRGMRERVTGIGGTLSACAAHGTFRVRADVPLDAR